MLGGHERLDRNNFRESFFKQIAGSNYKSEVHNFLPMSRMAYELVLKSSPRRTLPIQLHRGSSATSTTEHLELAGMNVFHMNTKVASEQPAVMHGCFRIMLADCFHFRVDVIAGDAWYLWTAALQRLRTLEPATSTRARSILRRWLTERTDRHGQTFVQLGLMLRDVATDCVLAPLAPDQEQLAVQEAERVLQDVCDLLQRRHDAALGARQPALVHEALLLAIRMDEMDVDLMPLPTPDQVRVENEVQLMIYANQIARHAIQGPPGVRSRRLRRLLRALEAHIGSESRHLRRMGVILHGLQMVGATGNEGAEVVVEEPWIANAVDELVLL